MNVCRTNRIKRHLSTRGLGSAGIIFLLTGCPTADDLGDDTDTGDTDLLPCETPLSISPSVTVMNPETHASLIPSGGTGAYRFMLQSEENGSEVHLETGSFYAGPIPNITETVILTDAGCEGRASAEIQIIPNLVVSPESIHLPVNTHFNWTTAGGSGDFTVSYFQNESGGSTTDQAGTTGPNIGHDILHITDQQTKQMVSIRMYIDTAINFDIRGAQMVLPLGASITPQTIGGSGLFDLSTSSTVVDVTDDVITGLTAGQAQVSLVDQNVPSLSKTIEVTVVNATGEDNGQPGGLFTQQNAALAPGDINGDGRPDAILGSQEIHGDVYRSGAVVVYSGDLQGLTPEPAQVLSGDETSQRFGYSMTTGDFNGDDELDIAIGAPYTSGTGLSAGAVFIYHGIEGGFFEPEPAQVVIGRYSYDRLGTALANCDINGDGLTDLITGARRAEDRNALTRANDQGAIHIFLNTGDGFSDEPEKSHWGQIHDGNTWVGAPSMLLGEGLATGDFNGDGQCDIAAGTYSWSYTGTGSKGSVSVYSGLDPEPYFWTFYEHSEHTVGEFGRNLVAADFDGDGADELIVSGTRTSYDSNYLGSAHVFWVSEYTGDGSTPVNAADADWLVYGNGHYDYMGKDIRAEDVNNDGVPDLIVTASVDELSGGPSGAGIARIFDGGVLLENVANTSGAYNASFDTPYRQFSGQNRDDRFGQSFVPLGDVNLDGSVDFFAYSAFADAFGIDVGTPYFINGSETHRGPSFSRIVLDLPVKAAGAQNGAALALYDANADGELDLFVGAPYSNDHFRGAQSGQISMHLYNENTWSPTVDAMYTVDVDRRTTRFGWDTTPIGDFNKDGYPDLAMVSYAHNAADTTATVPSGCDALNRGVAFIYLGTASGLSAKPAARIHAPSGLPNWREITGGFDMNGDGYDDLMLSNYAWNSNTGGAVYVSGRALSNDGSMVSICDGLQILGHEGGERLGFSIAPVGDLNNDNRDEVAISAYFQGMGQIRQGVIWVLWGTDSPHTNLEMTAIGTHRDYGYLGYTITGGADVDGDQIPDLISAYPDYRVSGDTVGALWLLSGAYIAGLSKTPANSGLTPATATVHPFLPDDDINYALHGKESGADFGYSLALVASPNEGEAHWVIVGAPYGHSEGGLGGGTAYIHRWIPDEGFKTTPNVIVATEPSAYKAHLGAVVTGDLDTPTFAVGSTFSHEIGFAQGAAYAAHLAPTEAP